MSLNPEDYDRSLPEHPDAIRSRLRRNGQWEEASKILERVKRRREKMRYREGRKATLVDTIDTLAIGFSEILEVYPTPPGSPPCESLREYVMQLPGVRRNRSRSLVDELTPEERARFEQIGETDNFVDDAVWVYHNHGEKRRAGEAPSRGAWELYCHVRSMGKRGREWFIEKVWKSVLPELNRRKQKAEEASELDYRPSVEERKSMEDLEAMLRHAVAESRELVG